MSDLAYRREVLAATEDGRRDVEVHILEGPGARLRWEVLTGEVYSLWVHPDHRRQGRASELWRRAGEIAEVRHSAWRTDDGDAFARAMGGELPPRLRA